MSRTLPDFHRSSFIVKNISNKNVDVIGLRLDPGHTSDLFVEIPGLTESMVIEATSTRGDIYKEVVQKRTLVIEESRLSTYEFDPDGIYDSMYVGQTLHISDDDGLLLDTPQWDDLRVPVTGITGGGGVKQPGFGKVADDGAGSTGVFTYRYDPDAEEELFFNVQMPHAWAEGTEIFPHIHWMPTSSSAGNVVWGLEYTKASIGDAFGDTTILLVTNAAGGVTNKHQIASWSSIDMTGNKISTMLVCRLFRDATDVINDTYGADAAALEVDFHYQVNSFGSRQVFIK